MFALTTVSSYHIYFILFYFIFWGCRETVTASIFVLSGEELKATISLDGPVAPLEADSGNALQKAIDEFDSGKNRGDEDKIINIEETVDFEHLNVKGEYEEDEEDDDEMKRAKDKDLTPSDRKKIKDRQRKKILVKRQKQEQQRLHQHRKVREEGQPLQTTVKAPAAGWYRFCVTGTWHQVGTTIIIILIIN